MFNVIVGYSPTKEVNTENLRSLIIHTALNGFHLSCYNLTILKGEYPPL